jgi:nicotinamide-nucleotide amidase
MTQQRSEIVVEVISIGDELLNGLSGNTNATWLCGRISEAGGRVVAVTTVGDTLSDIVTALSHAAGRAGLVIITGGLGPTSDDRTKDATLHFFGGRLVPVQEEIERIRLMFARRGLPLTELNIAQGWVPDTAVVLSNPVGTAPGMEFCKGNTTYLFLPGVPAEMKQIVSDNMHRWFGEQGTGSTLVGSDITTVGIGESFVAATLAGWEKELPEWLSLGYYPSSGMVRVRLSCTHNTPDKALTEIKEILQKAASHFPGKAFLTYGKSWDDYFFHEIKSRGLTIAAAESCTGGYLAHRITAVPGSSAIFRGSIVAYHNDIKTAILNVDTETLHHHGAVSHEAVARMAVEVRERLQSDIGVAISGIAGPDGGTPEKPVGTVWIALACRSGVTAEKFLLGSHRLRNIEMSAQLAMMMVLNHLA